MNLLPSHGRIKCNKCFTDQPIVFDFTKRTEIDWRITANPMAWGNQQPEIVVLGFSKGPTQVGDLANCSHNEVAYKGQRKNVGKILKHIGLINDENGRTAEQIVNDEISNNKGKFHFGSLIRCTVERYDHNSSEWKGSGGGMLDKFIASDFGQEVVSNCTKTHLQYLPESVRLIVIFGMGTNLNYVNNLFEVFKNCRPGQWNRINDIAYSDGKITVVHVEHFASQGSLIPKWLGKTIDKRSEYGLKAKYIVGSVFKE